MLTIKTPKTPNEFICVKCDFKCSKQSDWNRHISTPKHANNDKCLHVKRQPVLKKYKCDCGKEYGHRQSISIHRKKCSFLIEENIIPENSMTFLTNLVLEVVKNNADLLKSNNDLHKQMLEVCQTNNITNNTNISHNKTFNLNFFLNEQCKDAMNIMDFVDTFKLDFTDLDNVGKLGYVEGISNIIIQKLNEMDIYKRPIHCSDLKRETTHVKDKGVWEKDNGNHDKLRLAIRHIAKKNSDMLNPWIEAHPHAQASAHYLNNVYMNYIMQAMGGRGDIDDNETKIIKKIAKVILIDK